MHESIVEIVASHAGMDPDRFCVADKEGKHTYGELWGRSKEAALRLLDMGIGKGDCVMVECTQDAGFFVCNFACGLCGAIFVPVERRASAERVEEIRKDTDARLFLCRTAYDLPVERMSLETLLEQPGAVDSGKGSEGNPAMEGGESLGAGLSFPKKEDTAEILYTTGTTGASKGIEITHGNNIALAENVKYGTEMKEGNVEWIPLPLSHSHGLRCCYANMLNGSAVALTEGVSWVKQIFAMIEKYQVTSMDISPSAVTALHQLAKGKLSEIGSRMDYVQVGTEALPEHVKEILLSHFPKARLYNFYGSTESGRTCVLDFNKERGRAGCIGKPAKNASFLVTDEDRNPIESSKEHMGLLATAGAMNMKGYWKQPELTAQVMHGGYVYTNDLGYIDQDGYVYMQGRKDDIINYKGIKIAPEEIEESARKFREVLDCACVPKADKLSGQVPKLFVVARNKETFQKKDLFDFLKNAINANKMPKEIEVIDEIPRTYNGKVQRKKLVEKA